MCWVSSQQVQPVNGVEDGRQFDIKPVSKLRGGCANKRVFHFETKFERRQQVFAVLKN